MKNCNSSFAPSVIYMVLNGFSKFDVLRVKKHGLCKKEVYTLKNAWGSVWERSVGMSRAVDWANTKSYALLLHFKFCTFTPGANLYNHSACTWNLKAYASPNNLNWVSKDSGCLNYFTALHGISKKIDLEVFKAEEGFFLLFDCFCIFWLIYTEMSTGQDKEKNISR